MRWVVHRVNVVCDVIVKNESRRDAGNYQIAYRVLEVRQSTPEFTDLRLAQSGGVVWYAPANLGSAGPCDL
jgi:hypothetical protein